MDNVSELYSNEIGRTHELASNDSSSDTLFSSNFTWVWHPEVLSNKEALFQVANMSQAQQSPALHNIDWNNAPTGQFQPLPSLLRFIAALHSDHDLIKVLLQFSILLYEHFYLRSHPGDLEITMNLVASWRGLMEAVPGLTYGNLDEFRIEADCVAEYLESGPTVVEWFQSKLRIRQCDAYVLASITEDSYDELGKYRNWLNEQLAIQPRYVDLPSDFRPSSIDAWDHNIPYLAPILYRLLVDFVNEPLAVREVLYTICTIGNVVVRHLLDTNRQLLEDWLEFQDCMVEEFSKKESNPISDAGPLHLRQVIAQINIRGLTEFFAYVITDLWPNACDEYLGWRMHRLILQCAEMCVRREDYRQKVLNSFDEEWIRLITSDEPIVDWDPFPEYFSSMVDVDIEDIEDIEDVEDVEDEDSIPDDISDVSFEPVGDDYDVYSFATRVHLDKEGLSCSICHFDLTDTADDGPPMELNGCPHIFHHRCLSRHINGLESWSTKCPYCREIICKPRERRPKKVDVDS